MRHYKVSGLIGLVMLLGLGILACETSDVDRTFEGPYFVRFTDTTVTYKESYSKPIAIEVHNVGPQLDQPITITYTINGTAREGKEYTIVGTKGTVVIPAKSSKGNIMVQLINNANNILESTSLTFTLTGVQPSTLQVGFGKENIIGKSLVLTIQDDCLLGGSYTGTSRIGTSNYSVSTVAITSTDCKQYVLSNWNIGIPFFSFDAIKPTLTFIDNGDNSLTVPTQNNANLGSTDTVKGTGAWNPRNRVITLNLQFKLALTSTRDTTVSYTQTYTPQ
ncbi:hypothetical protein EXU85_05815 [Spirosoma sp. KCTC 42546]|uniref:hypothetical protein n=1 Tax=Spirosoma sp. KCTC 42546 TaxID=2520506 RepID=UPI00115836AC|nr:hypothetical protein [Spirosoma sp. KCTC 42546]QDK78138.1 hypothetical protein EXU85_05815 [Spirosoma sp. KCTC 42546]